VSALINAATPVVRRVDFSQHRAFHQRQTTDPAAVAAIDDPAAIGTLFAAPGGQRNAASLGCGGERAEADWLIGINGTRARPRSTRIGGFFKTTVGRVQTPTLAIVVERDQRIRNFVSEGFWEVIGTFEAEPANTQASVR